MKKIRQASSILFVLLMYCCGSSESRVNLENCKKLEIGMKEKEVLAIMGNPLSSRNYFSEQVKDTVKSLSFKYDVIAASTGIIVDINIKTDSVIHINCDEEVTK